MADKSPPEEESVEELADDAAERNPDPTTKREALELQLQDLDRTDEGAEVGDEMQ
jgi:hypothetical protein